ncbi:hypothetical protein PGTUg99_004833 [Puccinia graminis f. sp. tritici]|uniref:Uncharacterized protein n=1 Tax=Puccinia graminis f. sp. tritici TaxID=56615 RepID=A0A5B0NQD1_PUCGR|nr:hypothetical protein PGTUg99_004833 [Puccinia graminis f. sp. tritici]
MGKSCNSTSISKETCEVTHRSNPEEPEDRGYRVGSATTTQHTTRPEATAQYPTEDHERIPREKKPSITAEYRTNIIRMGRLAELQQAALKRSQSDNPEGSTKIVSPHELQLMRREYENNILGFVEECDRRIRAAQKRLEKTPEENNRTTGLMREIGEIQTGYEGAMGEVENLGRWLLRCFLEHVYKDIAFKVVTDTYVTSDSGAGNLHQAPAFGADDHEGYKRHGVVPADVIPPCPIDDGGRFTSDVPDFQGQHVKEADPRITQFWLVT